MFKFFESIAGFFETIVNFVVSLVSNIISVVSMIGNGLLAIGQVVWMLPDILKVFALALISYCIIINIMKTGG